MPVAPEPRRRRLEVVAVTLLFVALVSAMTWPQVKFLATHARDHQDVFFNLWRLRWIAHALSTDPTDLFNGNIFHPEPRTLALSDAMLVEGIVGAPLLGVGLPPVLVHNVLLLGALVASGVGMFVLARHLTGCRAGALAAGVIFSCAPYRFEHYMHMELQWIMWVPWTFWAFHRTLETGAWRYGLLTGLFLSLQMLSSIYYGVFLATLLSLVGALLLVNLSWKRALSAARPLAAGGLLALVVCGAYSLPYRATNARIGGRSTSEIQAFSARPSSYLVATPDNVTWGRAFAGRGRPERRLFPGALPVLLSFVGLLLRPPPVLAIAYLVGALAAFEMSLGLSGYSYRFLYDYVPVFQGFRAVARLGIFVVFFLSILTAFGYSMVSAGVGTVTRRVLAATVIAILLVEYRVQPMHLVRFPNDAAPLQSWLAGQPRGIVAHVPMASPDAFPRRDARHSYLSTFHWHPLVNGYSGFYPQSALDRIEIVRHFPNDGAIARLRYDGVRYLIVHLEMYDADQRELLIATLKERHGLAELGRFWDGAGEALVFRVR